MAINSRAKGASAEREFAGLMRDWTGVRLIRNLEQTRSGGHDLIVHPDETGDAADAFRKLAIECKRYQNVTEGNLQKWWAQAAVQAEQANLLPILAYRANRSPWRVVVPMTLLNNQLCNSIHMDYSATLSVKGFCHAVVEHCNARIWVLHGHSQCG
jgi:Holliday junction resolvase